MAKRLLAFVQKAPGISPGQRFRLEQWSPLLRREHGIELDFAAFESPGLTDILYVRGKLLEKGARVAWDYARRANAVRLAREYDGAVVYREAAALGPAFYEQALAKLDVPFVFDFDDSIWLSPPRTSFGVNGLFSHLRLPAKTRTIVRLASAVTVGNGFLAEWSRALNPNVFVVPTTIDLDRYPVQPEPPSADRPFVVGWMGSFSTLVHIDRLRPALERLGRRRPTELLIVCDRPLTTPIPGVKTRFVPWEGAREAEHIGWMDVGVMPLDDTEMSRGKCGCKALQYMAAGRATVVAPVGVNADIVRDGENGLWARDENEWVEALDRLAADPELRRRLAAAGRRTVEARFAAPFAASRFAEAVNAALAAR